MTIRIDGGYKMILHIPLYPRYMEENLYLINLKLMHNEDFAFLFKTKTMLSTKWASTKLNVS